MSLLCLWSASCRLLVTPIGLWRHNDRAGNFGTVQMLYKFKSKAAGDLIMLEPQGRRLLELMGKEAGPKGIILPEAMAAAVEALQAAIEQQEADFKAALAQAQAQNQAPPRPPEVSLRQRATPFIEMLRRCQAAEQAIVWGV